MGLSDKELRQLEKIVRYAKAVGLAAGTDSHRVRRSPAEKEKMREEIVAALENGAKAKDLARQYTVSLAYIYILKNQRTVSMALITNMGVFSGFGEYLLPLV